MGKYAEGSDADLQHHRPKVGVSSCLLGEPVRYDGQHKRDRFLTDTLGRYVEWVPVCPEVECGLSIPREAMRLVGDPESPRLLTSRTEKDMTGRMEEFSRRRVRELKAEDLSGFIFKSRSPTSGMKRVKVYDENGVPRSVGVGVFARIFMEHFPLLPVEDDGRLHDPGIRENFVERLFCLQDYRDTVLPDGRARDLVDFHSRYKMQLMAHNPELLKQMGRLVAGDEHQDDDPAAEYERLLMDAMRERATPPRHANVLTHILGFFKEQLTSEEKAELLELIEQYRRELIPLIVPVTLVRHYVLKYNQPYLAQQSYLNPHPTELKLRNHA